MTTTMPTTGARKSTIVRMFSAPWPVRASFGVLERIAPNVGARWAERIWFTLPVPRVHPSDALPPGGTPFALCVAGHDIIGTTWGQGPVVYAMHGWAGHGGQFGAFVEPLVERGYQVVVFDAPSHGRSAPGGFGPRSSTIVEFAAALNAVATRFGPAHGLIAHSMGCIAAAVALCDGLTANRLVMLAPMSNPATYAQQFGRLLNFGPRTYERLIRRAERRVGAPMRHFDVPAIGQAIAMPPTVIMHDRDDVSTSVADAGAIAAAWPSAQLKVTTGLGHRRILRDPTVVADAITHLTA